MKYAIVEAGGKQYRAEEGKTLTVDLLPVKIGDSYTLESILLISDGDQVLVGAPFVKGARLVTKVLDHVKGNKILIFKYKPKIHYRRHAGHRQQFTKLMVESIRME